MALVLLALALTAGLALPRLDQQPFWDDEANTALYARNLLDLGRITAWDGRNLIGYGLGGSLGEDLGQELRVPTLPAYVAAGSMAVLGQNTFAARLPFVLAGVATVVLLAVWAERHLGRSLPPWLPAMLLALSPAWLLYIRNCRYYALGALFSVVLWCLWAPGRTRRHRLPSPVSGRGEPDRRRFAVRCLAACLAFVLLAWSHYLNAALLLATLPLFFIHRRYRQPRQYALFGMLVATAVVYGLWVLATVNPLAADYGTGSKWLFAPAGMEDRWTRFYVNLGWFLRDLGTHEFFPWLLVPVLAAPFVLPLIAHWCEEAGWTPPRFDRLRRVRPLASRGLVLVLVVLVYVVLAAALLPADMGKGPTAEMRYVVPLLAVGSLMAALGVAVLWRAARPAGVIAMLLLVGTNWLHLGGLVDRFDRTSPWWPPTLWRYVDELCHDDRTGNGAMIELLARLPADTQVRIWPSFMAYPPMFYVPELRYCDQLTERKRIRADLREQLPDYLFVERAVPDVVIVPAPFLSRAIEELDQRFGEGKYLLQKAMPEHFNYTTKPEIPNHCFRQPPQDPYRYPGLVVLVAVESAVAGDAALKPSAEDARLGADAHRAAGDQLALSGKSAAAVAHYRAALRLDPRYIDARLNLGIALAEQGETDAAAEQYRQALAIEPDSAKAHYNLGNILLDQGELDAAEEHYRAALRSEPDYPQAHINLAEVLLGQGHKAEARKHLEAALGLLPSDSPLSGQIRERLRQIR